MILTSPTLYFVAPLFFLLPSINFEFFCVRSSRYARKVYNSTNQRQRPKLEFRNLSCMILTIKQNLTLAVDSCIYIYIYIYISRGQNLCVSNYFQQLYTFLNFVDSSICEIHPRSKIWTVHNINLISCWA